MVAGASAGELESPYLFMISGPTFAYEGSSMGHSAINRSENAENAKLANAGCSHVYA